MRALVVTLCAVAALVPGCRGDISSKPPVHPNQNMDFQKRFEVQHPNSFFADGRAMRMPVEGTVAIGDAREDDHFYRGKTVKVFKPGSKAVLAPGEVRYEFVKTLPPFDERGQPIVADEKFLARGQERFGIYCAICHGQTGDGNGINVTRGFVAPPDYWETRLVGAPIGHFFDVITNGKGNMAAYGPQIPPRDRWAIAAYIRVLQRRRAATLDQIPAAEAQAKGWSKKP